MTNLLHHKLEAQALQQALRLLNPWQRDFPLVPRPFFIIGQTLGLSEQAVLDQLQALQEGGALSRVGGVFAAQAGGAALLSAMAVPESRLSEVAACVSDHPGVNHNYERENAYNLWFVMTAPCADTLEASMQSIERQTGLPALRLPMRKPYRIDLGFDLSHTPQTRQTSTRLPKLTPSIEPEGWPLAALVEQGLPLVKEPFAQWAAELDRAPEWVMAQLQSWLGHGVLRRFGLIVRHHELGFDANAMTVFNVPDDQVDACGERLAQCAHVTLAYQRLRATTWPYNLYCMVHGRDRATVLAQIETLTRECGLSDVPREILFSRRRFKQIGSRRFRAASSTEMDHAHAG